MKFGWCGGGRRRQTSGHPRRFTPRQAIPALSSFVGPRCAVKRKKVAEMEWGSSSFKYFSLNTYFTLN
eukprot:UN06993